MKMRTFIKVSILLLLSLTTLGCNSTPLDKGHYSSACLDSSPERYSQLGISSEHTDIREDGMRTDGKSGSYEWWYIDGEFDDGTTVVVVFYTKNGFDVPGPARPTVTIDITFPDGEKIVREVFEPKGTEIRASREKADVSIGDCYLKYTDGDYRLFFSDGSVEYSLFMESDLPMWRPDTGHWYFGDEKEDFFAWFVAQPASILSGTLSVDGKVTELSGTGYHDHNWGNISMEKVINHWYWGRAKIGDYNLIAVDIISGEDTGFTRLPVFMIAKDGVILEDDQRLTEVSRSDTRTHEVTGKFYDNHLTYTQPAADGSVYTVEMIREKDIFAMSLLDMLPPFKAFAARLTGLNPSYIRSLGQVILTIEKEGEIQRFEQDGLWEQMFFGSNQNAYIWN